MVDTRNAILRLKREARDARDRGILERNLNARQEGGETLPAAIADLIERFMAPTWWQQPDLWLEMTNGLDDHRPAEMAALANIYEDARAAEDARFAREDDALDPMVSWLIQQIYFSDAVPVNTTLRHYTPFDPVINHEYLLHRYGHLVREREAELAMIRAERAQAAEVQLSLFTAN